MEENNIFSYTTNFTRTVSAGSLFIGGTALANTVFRTNFFIKNIYVNFLATDAVTNQLIDNTGLSLSIFKNLGGVPIGSTGIPRNVNSDNVLYLYLKDNVSISLDVNFPFYPGDSIRIDATSSLNATSLNNVNFNISFVFNYTIK